MGTINEYFSFAHPLKKQTKAEHRIFFIDPQNLHVGLQRRLSSEGHVLLSRRNQVWLSVLTGHSQPSATLVPGDSTPSSDLLGNKA